MPHTKPPTRDPPVVGSAPSGAASEAPEAREAPPGHAAQHQTTQPSSQNTAGPGPGPALGPQPARARPIRTFRFHGNQPDHEEVLAAVDATLRAGLDIACDLSLVAARPRDPAAQAHVPEPTHGVADDHGQADDASDATPSPILQLLAALDQLAHAYPSPGHIHATLRIDHPDHADFLRAKTRTNTLPHITTHVAIPDDFLEAVERKSSYGLIHPTSGRQVDIIAARPVWNTLLETAWIHSHPQITLIDRANDHRAAHQLPEGIAATGIGGHVAGSNETTYPLPLCTDPDGTNPTPPHDPEALIAATEHALRQLDHALDTDPTTANTPRVIVWHHPTNPSTEPASKAEAASRVQILLTQQTTKRHGARAIFVTNDQPNTQQPGQHTLDPETYDALSHVARATHDTLTTGRHVLALRFTRPTKTNPTNQPENAPTPVKKPATQHIAQGWTHTIESACGTLHITITEDAHGPRDLYILNVRANGCTRAHLTATAAMASLALRSGASVEDITNSLRGIRCNDAHLGDHGIIYGCADAIAHALQQHSLRQTGNPPVQRQESIDRYQP